jgi:alpha-D-ribose 1-methylphosphonate 5-triphosphate synthase subunit PhnH
MSTFAAPLASGFQEPVFDSQRAFRAAMEALATPGRIRPAGKGLGNAPVPAAAAAMALAHCDFETPVFLAPALAVRPALADYLRFYTDAVLVADPAAAAFALVDLGQDVLDLAAFAQGTAAFPDRSTTIIAIASSLTEGPGLTLSGPGIARTTELMVTELPPDFVEQWRANRASFPLGVDIIFTTSDAIVGLPRSTRIVGEGG